MTENYPVNDTLKQRQIGLPAEGVTNEVSGGIEEADVLMAPVDFSEQLHGANVEKFNDYVLASHDFVKNKLGMADVSDVSRATVLPAQLVKQWGVKTAGGQYLPELDLAYVFEPTDKRPKTSKLAFASSLVHELAHSASVTPENAMTEHSFYHEAVAGLAEYFAMYNLAKAGEFTQAPACTIKRLIDGEDVNIAISGSFRRVDASEVVEGKADTTQALIAAMVVGMGLKVSGGKASEILASMRKGDDYIALKTAVEAIEPGFTDFIAAQSGTTDGIIKLAQHAQQVMGIDRLIA
jgi:hypothetical protein